MKPSKHWFWDGFTILAILVLVALWSLFMTTVFNSLWPAPVPEPVPVVAPVPNGCGCGCCPVKAE